MLWTLVCMFLLKLEFSLDICPEVGFLHMVALFLVFLRNFHTFLHSGYTNLHSHYQHKRVPFSPQPLQHLLFVVCSLFDDSHFDCVTWYLIVVLSSISLIISNLEHLFMCLLTICLSSLEKVYLGLLPSFWLDLFIYLFFVLSHMSCL